MIRIQKWSELFENSDTRKRQRLGWFLSPTGCDSRGFRVLMRKGERGVIALGVFQGLCQLMGTLSKEARKTGSFLNSDGTGMEVADLWEMTRMQVANPLEVLEDLKSVGWLSIENKDVTTERATCVPPACHHHATSVPENSGFVKGEGEGEGEEPPKSPKGDGREIVPRGWRQWKATRQKTTKAFRNTEGMSRLGKLFGRRESTIWSVLEAGTWIDLSPTKEDVELIEEFYQAVIPQGEDFRRRDLITLLNNWNGECDRARLWQSEQL